MFSIELSLIRKTILSCFNKKINSQNLEIDLCIKNMYEKNNPINWSTDKCSICNFPLKIDPIGPDVPNNKMSYGDFFIRYEYTFLKNIYSKDELLSAPYIKNLADYYKTYQKFIRICAALQAMFVSHVNFDDLDEEFDPELKEFIQTNRAGSTLEEIQKGIENMEIKNIIEKYFI